jgi:hypothetical protein
VWNASRLVVRFFYIKSLNVGFAGKTLIDLIRRGVLGFMIWFCEQRFTTLNILGRWGVLLKMNRLLGKYFEANLGFCQGFIFAPVLLHFNKMKERGFGQDFLIACQVAGALKLPPEEGVYCKGSRQLPDRRP